MSFFIIVSFVITLITATITIYLEIRSNKILGRGPYFFRICILVISTFSIVIFLPALGMLGFGIILAVEKFLLSKFLTQRFKDIGWSPWWGVGLAFLPSAPLILLAIFPTKNRTSC
ncbi:MAG: hypothetical protein COB46_03110 [Rhodospirillaceae bacterium]|nr:MAG: hypothetical protein COB46_03110 [Rhodospirillaceae bacterium]